MSKVTSKTPKTFFARIAAVALLLWVFLAANLRAGLLDYGVDPAHLGKGDWIYILSNATYVYNCSVPALMALEKSQGMNFVIVKAGESNTYFPNNNTPQFTASLVTAAHNAGLKIFGYTRSYGRDIPGELNIITNILNLGADGYVVDAETEWETLPNNTNAAVQLLQPLRAMFPTRLIAHSPFMYISTHASFPYLQFGLFCDVVMPQAYWKTYGITPSNCEADLNIQWNNWQNSLKGSNTNAIKPICPIAQGWNPSTNLVVPAAEILQFHNALLNEPQPASAGGYDGESYFRCELHTTDMWSGIAAVTFSSQPSAPVITNQPSALSVNSGSNALFSVGASGTAPLSYQWLFNGTNLPGATTNTCTISNVHPTNAGSYSVIISNTVGSSVSSNAVLKVIPQTPLLNQIQELPNRQLRMSVSGDTGVSYIIEGSSNLLTWTPVATNVNSNGIFLVTYPAGNPEGYYRLRINQ